ncbi:CLUMA_CG021033, isoform B [Clunio marinus]|uniref:CLUMA_CG021033, isoform B n=1 Tax=Clunio marinus TaxID=568069 RepID=A0A1J1JB12_9DIPT|nr:CLUMA_CG021033, isoform B [Clunio marinus]
MKAFLGISVILSLIVVIKCGIARCDLPLDEGFSCDGGVPETRFYYNSLGGFCLSFEYLGCGGNDNSFVSSTFCETFCITQGDARDPSASMPSDFSMGSEEVPEYN